MKPQSMLKLSVFSTTFLLSSLVSGSDHQKKDLGEFLKEFKSNTAKVMNDLPVKERVSNGDNQPTTKFTNYEINDNTFISTKDIERAKICTEKADGTILCIGEFEGRAGIAGNDKAEQLVDNGYELINTLSEMDEKNLKSAKLSVKPWSDDYWAIAKGILGARYTDPNQPKDFDWKENNNYVLENKAVDLIADGFVRYLSPSEKYDFLVGDEEYTLTKKMWADGKMYYEQNGSVETWMGICHGWAAAAYMLDRPTSSIEVLAADGKTLIPFLPSDIKSLSSLLWANVRVPSKFVGGRCNEKDPKKDSENGRVIDQQCFDTNPGTWHISVVNQIGVNDRSFVMDATFDYEVWNQPVYSYNYSYFNPETGERFETAEEAAVSMEDFSSDKFKKYRSGLAKKVVGVEMAVEYIAETQPTSRTFDNENLDYSNRVYYRYDLELDGSNKIIGGEWYSNAHPDFLWTPSKEKRALTQLDTAIENAVSQGRDDLTWKVGESIPKVWREYIPRYNSQNGQPLALIVEGLIQRSNAEVDQK